MYVNVVCYLKVIVLVRDLAMPTLKDVARKAEVSIKTVSRVINNEAGVSEKLENGCIKSSANWVTCLISLAQRLKRGKSGLIALLLPRIESPYAAKLPVRSSLRLRIVDTTRSYSRVIFRAGVTGNIFNMPSSITRLTGCSSLHLEVTTMNCLALSSRIMFPTL